jgi:tight adherence protein B
MSNAVLIVLGIAVLLAAEGIYYFTVYRGQRRRAELLRRLRSVTSDREQGLLRTRRIARTRWLEAPLKRLSLARWLEGLLEQTDLTWTVATVIGTSLLLATAFASSVVLLLPGNIALAIVVFDVGLAIPTLAVLNARMRRSNKLSSQLPEALDMMVRSLRAGHGISSGFKLVSQEMAPPVAIEFARCFEEQNAGVEFREAVRNMTGRVPKNLDLKIFAVSIGIQHETGGNLVEILEQIANTIRERFKFYGKLRALTAEGRASGIVLGALPFICALLVALLNPGYLKPLVEDSVGRLFAIGGVSLWLLGVLWMRKLVQVDY